jgi:hypothetical protein
VFQELGFE